MEDMVLTYRDDRKDTGARPLVLLHPLGVGAWGWDEVVSLLPPSVRPVVYDRRGTLATNLPPRLWSFDDHVDDLEKIRESAGIDQWDIAGVAVSTLIACRYAVRFPNRVTTLVLCNPAEKTTPQIGQRAVLLRQGGINAVLPAAVDNAFADMPHDARYHRFLQHFSENDPLAYATTIDAICEEKESDDYGRVACPTLIMAALRDKIISMESVRRVADRIPGSQYREIDAAHFPHCQAPAEFVNLVLDFMFPNADWKDRPSQAAKGAS